MRDAERKPDLDAFIGRWTIEATHPAFPSTVVRGEASFEWLEGKHFLIYRSRMDHADFPDSLAIIGGSANETAMHYFDSRGVQRVYEMRFEDAVWTMSRDAPGFSQRFTADFADGGSTIQGLWRLSRDGTSWDDDLAVTFRRSDVGG